MYESERSQSDPQATAEIVLRTIEELERRRPQEGDELLADLLSAAWGTVCAQNQ